MVTEKIRQVYIENFFQNRLGISKNWMDITLTHIIVELSGDFRVLGLKILRGYKKNRPYTTLCVRIRRLGP